MTEMCVMCTKFKKKLKTIQFERKSGYTKMLNIYTMPNCEKWQVPQSKRPIPMGLCLSFQHLSSRVEVKSKLYFIHLESKFFHHQVAGLELQPPGEADFIISNLVTMFRKAEDGG